jgi:hypothetical protein
MDNDRSMYRANTVYNLCTSLVTDVGRKGRIYLSCYQNVLILLFSVTYNKRADFTLLDC